MRYIYLISLLFLLTVTHTSRVNACGGGANFVIDYLTEYDNIVRATVIDVDERGYNAILQVHDYFKGNGTEYITVMRYAPALEYARAIRGYDTSCLYTGGGREWVRGSTAYFALSDNENGTQTDSIIRGVPEPHFFVENGMINFLSFNIHTDIRPQEQSLTATEFESLLLDYGGQSDISVPEPTMYPLMRFLTITTESGQQYQLNPDYSLSRLDENTLPLAISYDGSHIVFRPNDTQLGFQYYFFNPESERVIFQNGYNATFSPDSNFVAVQDTEQLVIYMFDNYESGGYGHQMRMQTIAEIDTSWSNNDFDIVAWSPDSSTIAYQEEQGIWSLNIFESADPQLIVSSDDGLMLLDVSESGRYVRFEIAETWVLLETQTGNVFERAISTPDERNLIYIQTDYPEDALNINRRGDRECFAPLAQTCPIYVRWSGEFNFFWYKNDQIALWACYDENGCYINSQNWNLSINNGYGEVRLDFGIPLTTIINYDSTYDQIVSAVNGYVLEFSLYSYAERQRPPHINFIDLTEQLDSPIIELEWGQPIFYEINQ